VFGDSQGSVAGALRLRTPGDPLAVAVERSVDPDRAAVAWVLALVAYAQLTCVAPAERDASAPSGGRTWKHARDASAGGGRPQSRTAAPTRVGSLVLSASLRPTGQTAALLASYVAGHRRRLRSGRRSSERARRSAEAVGIELGDAETWVRPHTRGVPDDAVLTFAWRPPSEVDRRLTTESAADLPAVPAGADEPEPIA
jgi:hypothetical protein